METIKKYQWAYRLSYSPLWEITPFLASAEEFKMWTLRRTGIAEFKKVKPSKMKIEIPET